MLHVDAVIYALKYLPVDPKGAEYPPAWYMAEPQIGPSKKPIPVDISIRPIFCSRSDGFELDTTIAMDATAFMPEPRPPIICAANDKNRKVLAPLTPAA